MLVLFDDLAQLTRDLFPNGPPLTHERRIKEEHLTVCVLTLVVAADEAGAGASGRAGKFRAPLPENCLGGFEILDQRLDPAFFDAERIIEAKPRRPVLDVLPDALLKLRVRFPPGNTAVTSDSDFLCNLRVGEFAGGDELRGFLALLRPEKFAHSVLGCPPKAWCVSQNSGGRRQSLAWQNVIVMIA